MQGGGVPLVELMQGFVWHGGLANQHGMGVFGIAQEVLEDLALFVAGGIEGEQQGLDAEHVPRECVNAGFNFFLVGHGVLLVFGRSVAEQG